LSKKSAYISVDVLRAIAALGVFYYHTHIGTLLANYSGIKAIRYTDAFGATFAVPLFFLISGYCIHLSNIKYLEQKQSLPLKKYYIKRFLRIYPPYLLALLASIATNVITDHSYHVSIPDVIYHTLLLQGFSQSYFNKINVVLWTITTEMAFYILYPIFYHLRLKYSINKALLTTFIVSVFSIAYVSTMTTINLPQRFFVLNIWFAWCCGAWIADNYIFNPQVFKHKLIIFAYLLIVILFTPSLFFMHKTGLQIVTDQLDILIWGGPLLWFLQLEPWFRKNQSLVLKIVVSVGLSSYSLYLFHEPLLSLKNYLVHQLLPPVIQPFGVAVGVLFIPVITWFSYQYVEKPFITSKRKTQVDNEIQNSNIGPLFNDTI